MKQHSISLRWCLLVYLCLTGVNLIIHNRMIDSQPPYLAKRQELHDQVLNNEAPAPIQYRIMAYYSAELFQRMGFGFQNSYLLFRGITIFLAAIMFHLFLSRYFPINYCFMGVLYLLGVMPMTFINYYMQESDAANLFFFLGSFLIIRSRKDAYLFPLIIVAMLNRETPVLIPLIWLFFRWDELKLTQVLIRFFALLATAFGTYVGLRFIYGHHESYSEFFYLLFNLSSFNSYLYFAILFAPFIVLAYRNRNEKPKFFRRALLFVPFFLIFHLTIPIFQESRLLLPLIPIILSAGLCHWYRPDEQDTYQGNVKPLGWLIRYQKIIYGIFLIVFIGQIWVFYQYVEVSHVRDWRIKSSAEQLVKQGQECLLNQNYQQARERFAEALTKNPDSFETNFYLGWLYTYQFKDDKKALFHWNKCLSLQPQHPRIQEVLAGIDRIKQ
ncbi:MAG: hypothetical protein GF384_08640 [Elusimicrobia bacterium]|nr:hypothetical protein [Elusimicrobiota bacterium]MBD3412683.1 hypothetical protein [Elusimicrobiota bacterium]